MAGTANLLTDRVTMTVPASDVRVLIAALSRLGYRSSELTVSAGLPDGDAMDPDARVTCAAYGNVLACAYRQKSTANLALQVARATPLGAYPLIDYLVLSSDTVGDGIRQLARYFRLVSNPVGLEVDESSGPVRMKIVAAGAGMSFAVEHLAALTILHMQRETNGQFAAAHVSFQHTPDDPREFEHVLGCRVRAHASWNGVAIAADAWRLPLQRRDPVLRQMLEGQADAILARQPTREGLALQVQRALAGRVSSGDVTIGTIARQLAVSGRTLQRRLAAEGASYQELLDETRKEAAGRFLADSTLAIGEVAYLVGYSEPAPFHRAFQRWYQTTPESFRQKQREG